MVNLLSYCEVCGSPLRVDLTTEGDPGLDAVRAGKATVINRHDEGAVIGWPRVHGHELCFEQIASVGFDYFMPPASQSPAMIIGAAYSSGRVDPCLQDNLTPKDRVGYGIDVQEVEGKGLVVHGFMIAFSISRNRCPTFYDAPRRRFHGWHPKLLRMDADCRIVYPVAGRYDETVHLLEGGPDWKVTSRKKWRKS